MPLDLWCMVCDDLPHIGQVQAVSRLSHIPGVLWPAAELGQKVVQVILILWYLQDIIRSSLDKACQSAQHCMPQKMYWVCNFENNPVYWLTLLPYATALLTADDTAAAAAGATAAAMAAIYQLSCEIWYSSCSMILQPLMEAGINASFLLKSLQKT